MVYTIPEGEEEREKFRDLNAGKSPSSDDILQQYSLTKPFLIDLINQVKLTAIYKTPKRPLKLGNLITAYLNAKKPKLAVQSFKPFELLNKIDKMGIEDLKIIKAFLRDYQSTFGVLNMSCDWIKSTIFASIFRLWYQNLNNIPQNVMLKKFRNLINHSKVKEYSRMGGRDPLMFAVRDFCEVLNNKGSKKYTFVIEGENATNQ